MIEKMKFLSIAGPKDDIDRVIDQYLSKYEIHLENALSELKTVASLRPYTETNPYKAELQTAAGLMESYHDHLPSTSSEKLSLKEAVETVRSLDEKLQTLTKKKDELEKEADVIRNSINNVIPFANLNYDLKDILHFKYVKFRFGRMPRDYYNKFMTYIYNTIDTVIHPCMEDADYIWAVYFVPHALCDKIDAIYASMHFERFFLPFIHGSRVSIRRTSPGSTASTRAKSRISQGILPNTPGYIILPAATLKNAMTGTRWVHITVRECVP